MESCQTIIVVVELQQSAVRCTLQMMTMEQHPEVM